MSTYDFITGKQLKKYLYYNYMTKEIVFECVACNISVANSLYEEKTGSNPIKQNFIGCSINEEI
jgi:hypothetical protein